MPKPWTIRPMTPKEEMEDPTAYAITDRETKEITYIPGVPVEGIVLGLRHEIGHVRYNRPKYWFYPETEGMDEDSSAWLAFKEENPLWDVREDFFCELLANYYSLSVDPKDPAARRAIKLDSDRAIEEGLSRVEVELIKRRARETVGRKTIHRRVR